MWCGIRSKSLALALLSALALPYGAPTVCAIAGRTSAMGPASERPSGGPAIQSPAAPGCEPPDASQQVCGWGHCGLVFVAPVPCPFRAAVVLPLKTLAPHPPVSSLADQARSPLTPPPEA